MKLSVYKVNYKISELKVVNRVEFCHHGWRRKEIPFSQE